MGVANFDWKRMKSIQKLHRVLYALGLGPIVGRIIMLLTTTGRKTGLKRVTPLQYEQIEGRFFLGAARGVRADWVRNIQADPRVEVRVKRDHFQGLAEVVTDPARIADFIEVRLWSAEAPDSGAAGVPGGKRSHGDRYPCAIWRGVAWPTCLFRHKGCTNRTAKTMR